jgi:hypothetical protein
VGRGSFDRAWGAGDLMTDRAAEGGHTPPPVPEGHVFEVYFKLYQTHNALTMHQERSQYVLMRAFFQIITVVFIIEHLPLQLIKDQNIVMILSLFIKASLLLTSYTILRKAHWANYHEEMSRAYLQQVNFALKLQENKINLDIIEHKIVKRYDFVNYFIFPKINRIAVGITFILFSVTIAAFVTIK